MVVQQVISELNNSIQLCLCSQGLRSHLNLIECGNDCLETILETRLQSLTLQTSYFVSYISPKYTHDLEASIVSQKISASEFLKTGRKPT